MAEIEPWFRLSLALPHAAMPYLPCSCPADVIHVFMSFSELERAGWIALAWLIADAVWKIIRAGRRKPSGDTPPHDRRES
jgi:hypothetical protein